MKTIKNLSDLQDIQNNLHEKETLLAKNIKLQWEAIKHKFNILNVLKEVSSAYLERNKGQHSDPPKNEHTENI